MKFKTITSYFLNFLIDSWSQKVACVLLEFCACTGYEAWFTRTQFYFDMYTK